MKKWTVHNRRFLNVPKSNCMGAVNWSVNCYSSKPFDYIEGKPKDGPTTWKWTGEISINKDAMDQYVTRKADLRPVYAMRTELNKFIAASEKAINDARKQNAKIKDTT